MLPRRLRDLQQRPSVPRPVCGPAIEFGGGLRLRVNATIEHPERTLVGRTAKSGHGYAERRSAAESCRQKPVHRRGADVELTCVPLSESLRPDTAGLTWYRSGPTERR